MARLKRKFTVLASDKGEVELCVAFASDDGLCVNQHFGSATGFVLYNLNKKHCWIKEAAQFSRLDECSVDGKLQAKLDLVRNCSLVFCRACGAAAMEKLEQQAVTVVKVKEATNIKHLLAVLKKELNSGSSDWLGLNDARSY